MYKIHSTAHLKSPNGSCSASLSTQFAKSNSFKLIKKDITSFPSRTFLPHVQFLRTWCTGNRGTYILVWNTATLSWKKYFWIDTSIIDSSVPLFNVILFNNLVLGPNFFFNENILILLLFVSKYVQCLSVTKFLDVIITKLPHSIFAVLLVFI